MNAKPLIVITIILSALLTSAVRVTAGDINGTVKVLGGKGLQNVVVYIQEVQGKTFAPPQKPAVLDQIRMTFIPHVLPILVGTTVEFPNSDSTRHNVFSPSKTKRFNLGTYPAGVTKKLVFDRLGVVALLCNVHAEMSAFVLVLQNPNYAMPDKRGVYTIREVPAGSYKLVAWHERLKVKEREVEVPEKGQIVVDFFLDE